VGRISLLDPTFEGHPEAGKVSEDDGGSADFGGRDFGRIPPPPN